MRTMWNEPTIGERHVRRSFFGDTLAGVHGYVVVEWDGEQWDRKLKIWRESGRWLITDHVTIWTAGSENGAVASALNGSYVLLPHAHDCCCEDCNPEGDSP